jgi:hypothetical protein
MDFPPAPQHGALLLGYNPHRLADIARFHAIGIYELRRALVPDEVDLCRTIAKSVDMRRFMVIGEYDEANPTFAMNRDHESQITNLDGFFKRWNGDVSSPDLMSLRSSADPVITIV